MDWTVDPSDDVPLYKQLRNNIKKSILEGELKPDAQLPSVRELAEKCDLNPNTVAKVLRELQMMGLVYSRRGMGVFVAPIESSSATQSDEFLDADAAAGEESDEETSMQPHVDIEAEMEIKIAAENKSREQSPTDSRPHHFPADADVLPTISAVSAIDSFDGERPPYLTIGQMEAAKRLPPSVRGDDSVRVVRTRMLLEGVGHLPVLNGPRTAEGIISWESLARRLAGGTASATAREYMDPNVRVVKLDTVLFDAVRDIIKSGAVLVRGKDNSICGLVTARDIAEQFLLLSEPFLYLEQIENHLRSLLIRAKLTPQQLHELVDPSDVRRNEGDISIGDLTFGEYVRAMENENIWTRIDLGIDRRLFTRHLQEVRRIRNAVMHFHPDGITNEDRGLLARTRAMLQGL